MRVSGCRQRSAASRRPGCPCGDGAVRGMARSEVVFTGVDGHFQVGGPRGEVEGAGDGAERFPRELLGHDRGKRRRPRSQDEAGAQRYEDGEAGRAGLRWICFHNLRRRHRAFGYLGPARFEHRTAQRLPRGSRSSDEPAVSTSRANAQGPLVCRVPSTGSDPRPGEPRPAIGRVRAAGAAGRGPDALPRRVRFIAPTTQSRRPNSTKAATPCGAAAFGVFGPWRSWATRRVRPAPRRTVPCGAVAGPGVSSGRFGTLGRLGAGGGDEVVRDGVGGHDVHAAHALDRPPRPGEASPRWPPLAGSSGPGGSAARRTADLGSGRQTRRRAARARECAGPRERGHRAEVRPGRSGRPP